MTPIPSQSTVQIALVAFLKAILPSSVSVVNAQVNRVPPPAGTDYVYINAVGKTRLATNVDTYADAQFTASISGKTMTVTAVQFGTIVAGAPLYDVGAFVPLGTAIVSGPGGIGSYQLSATLGVIARETMAAGQEFLLAPTQLTYQVDVYGPNSADNSQTISTMFRDDYATQWWVDNGYDPGSAPLYADDPMQMPFLDEEQQIETRWSVKALLQTNQTITVPRQFAAALTPVVTEINSAFKP